MSSAICFLLTFLLCVIVLLSCQCAFSTLAGPVGPAFSVSSRSAFLCYAFACVFPSASFHLPTLGVQAAESGLTNYWKPFLFLPCYCDTVRPPLYFLRTFIMLSWTYSGLRSCLDLIRKTPLSTRLSKIVERKNNNLTSIGEFAYYST